MFSRVRNFFKKSKNGNDVEGNNDNENNNDKENDNENENENKEKSSEDIEVVSNGKLPAQPKINANGALKAKEGVQNECTASVPSTDPSRVIKPISHEERIASDAKNISSMPSTVNPNPGPSVAFEAMSQKLNDIIGSLNIALNSVDGVEPKSEQKRSSVISCSSTEHESFTTAPEETVPPLSQSSSFQTASNCSSVLLSSNDKNTSDTGRDVNTSTHSESKSPAIRIIPIQIIETSASTSNVRIDDDENSRNATPTIGAANFQSILVESETELESHMEMTSSLVILNEETPAPLLSFTPEVSTNALP